ncbi:hypothetical protein [Piscirickettsia litoralis]|uniref:hypothetical protein n=1 Tax=Piscirickettsia litoralis TaxID=1891921 RepID=UPI000AC44B0D|nr:hypothetical protein [Piscirickettsia litoralis]
MSKKYKLLSLVKRLSVAVMFQMISSRYCYASTNGNAYSFVTMSKNWQETLTHIAIFVQFASALSGVMLVIIGLVKLRQNQANQGQQQNMMVGSSYLIIGGMLLALGCIVVVLSNSVNPVDGGITQGIKSIMGFAPPPSTPTNIYDGIIIYFLMPFLQLIDIISPVVGIITLCVGVHRLRYHTNPQMMSMHRRSPMATGFYFFVGSVLLAPFYIIQALSGSLFETPQLIQSVCGVSEETFLSYFGNLENQYIISFAGGGSCIPVSSATSTTDNLIKLTYAVLFVVGFMSFLRGIFSTN